MFAELIRHPVTVAEVDDHMVGCNYDTRKARFIMEKIGELLTQLESQLGHVDDCLKTYRNTIDKKISVQTTREVERIKMCQVQNLYPPATK